MLSKIVLTASTVVVMPHISQYKFFKVLHLPCTFTTIDLKSIWKLSFAYGYSIITYIDAKYFEIIKNKI